MLNTSDTATLTKALAHLATCRCAGSAKVAEELGNTLTLDSRTKAQVKGRPRKQKRGPAGKYYLVSLSNVGGQWCQGATDTYKTVDLTSRAIGTRWGGGPVTESSFRTTLASKGLWERNVYAQGVDQTLTVRRATAEEALQFETEMEGALPTPASLLPAA